MKTASVLIRSRYINCSDVYVIEAGMIAGTNVPASNSTRCKIQASHAVKHCIAIMRLTTMISTLYTVTLYVQPQTAVS